jgi:hypothetical protein
MMTASHLLGLIIGASLSLVQWARPIPAILNLAGDHYGSDQLQLLGSVDAGLVEESGHVV